MHEISLPDNMAALGFFLADSCRQCRSSELRKDLPRFGYDNYLRL